MLCSFNSSMELVMLCCAQGATSQLGRSAIEVFMHQVELPIAVLSHLTTLQGVDMLAPCHVKQVEPNNLLHGRAGLLLLFLVCASLLASYNISMRTT